MRAAGRLLLTSVLTASVTAGWIGAAANNASSQGATSTINGRVVIEVDRTLVPVRRARITATGAGRDFVTDSDLDGRFSISGIPAGDYRLRAEKPGFVHFQTGAHRVLARTVAPGQTLAMEIRMQRGAGIEGRVTDGRGRPLADIAVAALRIGYGVYGRRTVPVAQVLTDDLGQFRVHSLPPGNYYVDAAPDGVAWATRESIPGETPTEFVRLYYPGTPRLDEARAVTLPAGADMTGVDFQLSAIPAGRISGRVADAASRKPVAYAVRIQRAGRPPGEVRGFMLPPPESTFAFQRVPPGEYVVLASAIYASGAPPEFAVERVNVTAGQDMNLTLQTSPGAQIDGRLESEDGTPAPLAGVRVVAHQFGYELPAAAPDAGGVTDGDAGADGRIRFSSLVGRRVFRVTGMPDGWALARVALGDADITDSPAEFGGSAPTAPLRVIVTPQVGAAQGTTVSANGQPHAEARVVVFSTEGTRWQPLSRFIHTAMSSSNGGFAIANLLPGDYYVVAVDHLDDGAWQDPQVLSTLREGAARVSIAANASSPNLRLVVRSAR